MVLPFGEDWRLTREVLVPMEQGIVVVDGSGRIAWVNPAFTQVTGYEAGEVLGRAFSDVSARKNDEALIANLRYHDSLTGLPNWEALQERLEAAVEDARSAGRMMGVMLVTLDRFKHVNEALGFGAGDLILETLAERLVRVLGPSATVARRGGDEFGIVLPPIAGSEQAARMAQRLLSVISRPLRVVDQDVVVTASVGLGLYPDHGDNTAILLDAAHAAVNRAKVEGGNGFRFYQPALNGDGRRRLALESGLHAVLERGELRLRYQPQVDLTQRRVVGVEALVRWEHPQLGMVLPSSFIPLAEQSGAIVPIGEWVLREACRQVGRWRDQGYDLRLAVNLSPRQFRHTGLVRSVERALEESGLASSRLELEITESSLADDPAGAARVLREIKNRGVEVSVDDFGTGYSSLSSLKRFPLDRLKIDRCFVENCCSDADDAAIVDAVIRLARALRLQAVGEGVETRGQMEFLERQGCRYAQGYLFSPPLEPAEFCTRFDAAAALGGHLTDARPC